MTLRVLIVTLVNSKRKVVCRLCAHIHGVYIDTVTRLTSNALKCYTLQLSFFKTISCLLKLHSKSKSHTAVPPASKAAGITVGKTSAVAGIAGSIDGAIRHRLDSVNNDANHDGKHHHGT